MNTHNICFRGEIRKILTWYPLLSIPMVPELLLQTSSCVNSIYICTYKLEFNSITISWSSHTDENAYVFEDYGHFNVFQWDLFHRNTDGLTYISKNKDLCFENHDVCWKYDTQGYWCRHRSWSGYIPLNHWVEFNQTCYITSLHGILGRSRASLLFFTSLCSEWWKRGDSP